MMATPTSFSVRKEGTNSVEVFTEEKPVPYTDDALYRYTWPGQSEKTVRGHELNTLCRGANAALLNISQLTEAEAEAFVKAEEAKALEAKKAEEKAEAEAKRAAEKAEADAKRIAESDKKAASMHQVVSGELQK